MYGGWLEDWPHVSQETFIEVLAIRRLQRLQPAEGGKRHHSDSVASSHHRNAWVQRTPIVDIVGIQAGVDTCESTQKKRDEGMGRGK